jgi:type IV pilus assembly protein PilC
VISAMIYPAVVITFAFTIILLLMTFVIPQFTEVLTEMTDDGELPALTRYVMGASRWIAFKYGWAVIVGIPFGTIFFLRFARRFRTGRFVLDSIKLKIPVVGQLSGKISVTRWTRTLGTLISAGVPILDAITVTAETAGNEVYGRMLTNVHDSIRQGETFADPLKKSKTVDLIVSNMVAVGEETGDLDKMLLKIADNYDEQVDVLVAGLMSMLEPIMVVVLGLIVMVIVLSVFLPMIKIITSMTG